MAGLMLHAESLSVYTEAKRSLLKQVSVSFFAGQVTALIGPNGAGKTTLLRALAGLLACHSGSVFVQGQVIEHLSLTQRARQIAYVPQETPFFPPMTVCEITSLGRLPYGENARRALAHPAVHKAIDMTGLSALADQNACHLSGGERARLMLARALAVEAPILLADEPVASLDPAHALAVMALFRSLAAQGHCVVVVIHDLLLATRFCDRLVLLKDGEVVKVVTPLQLDDALIAEIYGVTTRRVGDAVLPWDILS